MASSVLILLACVITTLIPPASNTDPKVYNPQFLCLVPLTLLGVGYSVYAAALWGCIPYTVPARLVGTAYGLCTAIQNIGLTISPLIGSTLLERTTKEQGYFWLMMYFVALAAIGIVFNVWLYIDDLRNRGGILDKVDEGENLQELMTSPTGDNRRKFEEDDGNDDAEMHVDHDETVKQGLLEYKKNKEMRDSLRRSVAKNSAPTH